MRLGNGVLKSLAALALLGLLLFLSTTKIFSSIEEGVLKIFRPLFGGATLARQTFSDAAEGNKGGVGEVAEILKLRAENERLRRTLRFSEERSLPLRGGRVLHYRVELGQEFIFIDQGSRAGIKAGDFAIDRHGFLAGIVKKTHQDISQIEIASNPGETLEVEILPLKIRALAKGLGGRTLALELLPIDTPIRVGDLVLSLGAGSARFSFALGEIASVTAGESSVFAQVSAVMLARPEELREVFIVERRALP